MTILDRFSLEGRTAVVTGGSSGLGAAIAVALAEAGADVVVAARRLDRLEGTASLVRARGRRALCVVADVSDASSCRDLGGRASELGPVSILVNAAGMASATPALHESEADFERVVRVNLMGTYWACQSVARVMPPSSSIVNVASVLAVASAGLPQAAYAASKAGVLGLTRDLAAQWTSRKGIRVNALIPGYFPSEMTDDYPEGWMERQVAAIPAGRIGDPQELAAAAVFLASDASSYITAATLVVDGGLTTSHVVPVEG